MGDQPPYQDEETLKRLYRAEGKTMAELAEQFDVTQSTIHRWIHKFDIQPRYSGTLEERFHQYYEKDEETGCWFWQNEPDEWGYGTIGIGGEKRKAHRVSFDLLRDEPLPDFDPEHQVNHTCHNPSCVNPDHLYIGSAKENMDDALEVDAWGENRARGSKVGTSKITEDEVAEIKRRCNSGETQKAVSEDYDVSHSMVNKIMVGEFWSHVSPASNE